jgi:hypothetical protein
MKDYNSLKKLTLAAAVCVPTIFTVHEAAAHNVWCHCGKTKSEATLRFFNKAGQVYAALKDMMDTWNNATIPLEAGVINEFEHAVHGSELHPEKFRETLLTLQLLKLKMAVLEGNLRDLRSLAATDDNVPEFEAAVTNILKGQKNVWRLSLQGVRYSDVAGVSGTANPPIVGLTGIIDAQIEDIQILSNVLDEVISDLRDAIPLAEKGEFARVMLSGRNGFGDKMPQLTDMVYAYERLYVSTCMSTIQATMQVYPKGFEWLGSPK